MPLRVAEKDEYIYAVNKCNKDCPFCFRMLTGIKAHLTSGEKPSGLGCFHDEITTRKEIGKEIKPDCIPVWCPLPEPKANLLSIKEIEDSLKKRGLGS